MIVTTAYPRAAIAGNPSDGYFGKTVAFTFRNFEARTTLCESPELEIQPCLRDQSRFNSVRQLAEDVRRHGYYGGVRLIKGAIKTFYDHCAANGIALHDRNFTIRYETTIPTQVGLAGSSAIITACMRALLRFYKVEIDLPILANLVHAVEAKELGIPAGLQDRVTQVHDGLVYMDFGRALMERRGYGNYERLDPGLLPPLYIAYRTDLAEGSEIPHANLRDRWNRGDPDVVTAMRTWAALAEQVRGLLLRGEGRAIGPCLDQNFDMRRSLYRLGEENIRMVESARAAGASATFTGSGGAIVGTYESEDSYRYIEEWLAAAGARVLKPDLVEGPVCA
jgi:glucuronokinase